MYVPKDEAPKFEPCPDGTHAARCIRFIDLGSHEQKYQGESKGMKRLVMLSFEIPGEKMDDGRPFTISKRYNWSMHEKSTLRKHLEAWRGQKFKDEDLGPGGFDIRSVLGKTCTVSVIHRENNEGDVFANIESVGKPMRGMEVDEQVNPTVYVALDAAFFEQEQYDQLSDKLKEFIRQSPEWERLQKPRTNGYAQQKGTPDDPKYGGYDERNPPPHDRVDERELEDEIPF